MRTRFEYRHDSGEVVIHPAEGDLELVPERRRYRLVLVGAGDEQVLELGEVPTAAGATARFSGAREFDNQVEQRLFALLDRAEIGFTTKQQCFDAITQNPTAGRRMAVLRALGLDPVLLDVLAEVVLARE